MYFLFNLQVEKKCFSNFSPPTLTEMEQAAFISIVMENLTVGIVKLYVLYVCVYNSLCKYSIIKIEEYNRCSFASYTLLSPVSIIKYYKGDIGTYYLPCIIILKSTKLVYLNIFSIKTLLVYLCFFNRTRLVYQSYNFIIRTQLVYQ